MSTKFFATAVLPPPPGGEGWGEGASGTSKRPWSRPTQPTNLPFCPLSPGERAGEREAAFCPSLERTQRPSPLTPRPSPGQALPPRGEGNSTGGKRALIAASMICMSLAHAQPPDPALEARVKALSAELRCLVCQNQTVEDSSAPVARDMKEQVRLQLAAGKSEAEVKAYMTDRFGDFVLYKPPLKATTIVLWAGPFIALAFAGLLLVRRLRSRSCVASATPLSDVDRERARTLLNTDGDIAKS